MTLPSKNDQSGQLAAGDFSAPTTYDGSEIPKKSTKLDEAVPVFGTPVYFEFLAGKRGLYLLRLGNSTRKHPWWKGPV